MIHDALIAFFKTFFSFDSPYYQGKKSAHFDGKRFFDPEFQDKKSFSDFLKWRFTHKSAEWPDQVNVEHYDVPPTRVMGDALRLSNVGHVTFLIQTQGLNILTDPVWSSRASPLSFAGPKRVIAPGIMFEALPPIDIVWVSHNHYDHLDIDTIDRLWHIHQPRIITPLGNDRLIHAYNQHIPVETYDWGDQINITHSMTFHLSPMQHWSARGVFDRNKALWAALTIETDGGNIYFVGDSGYGDGRYFKRDKEKFGTPRLALLPMGAYEPRWFMEYAHMNPEEMLKAYRDMGEPYTVPSHYDVFKLADEKRGGSTDALKEAMIKYRTGELIRILDVGQHWYIPKLRAHSSISSLI